MLRRLSRSVMAAWLGFANGWAYASTNPRNPRDISKTYRPRPSSANAALVPAMEMLTGQGRDLERSAPLARAIVDGFRADVVGNGIGVQPMTADPALNVALLRDFEEWAEDCGVLGESLWDLQWQGVGELPPAGAILWRWVVDETAPLVPLRLVALEIEWLSPTELAPVPAGRTFVRGIEQDALGRPLAYHLRNPDSDAGEVVPAIDIIHVFIRRRARQAHGEPGLCTLVERLLQDSEIIATELKSAKTGAVPAGFIETPDSDLESADADTDGTGLSAGSPVSVRPGVFGYLAPGEKAQPFASGRPSPDVREFRGTVHGDLAAGSGVSRQWLDRDSARANWSSMREDRSRDERLLGPVKLMLGRHMAGKVYLRVLPFLLIRRGLAWPAEARKRAALARYELRPDRPEYVNPLEDAKAIDFQVQHNQKTMEEALAERGRSFGDVLTGRSAEIAKTDAATVARVVALHKAAESSGVPNLAWYHLVTLDGAVSAPGAYLQGAAGQSAQDAPARSADPPPVQPAGPITVHVSPARGAVRFDRDPRTGAIVSCSPVEA